MKRKGMFLCGLASGIVLSLAAGVAALYCVGRSSLSQTDQGNGQNRPEPSSQPQGSSSSSGGGPETREPGEPGRTAGQAEGER